MSERIYVASSWRNPIQPAVVETLRAASFEVYDFRNPSMGDRGFHWSEIDPGWERWDASRYINALTHPVAISGFRKDFEAMKWADTFVLVMPCGRSAHLELGWAVGEKKDTAILLEDEGFEPELMYKMADLVTPSMMDLLDWLGVPD